MPQIGIILGSGLHDFAKSLNNSKVIHEDSSTFHFKRIIQGSLKGENLLIFEGRNHFYEGFEAPQVLENIDFARKEGIKLLIITNAAGGINTAFNVADLMLASSHINLQKRRIPCSAGSRNIYRASVIDKIKELALERSIRLRTGVYCSLTGPVYESIAEYHFLKRIGADAVGMSTVPEVLYANSAGIKTITISCITNLLTGSPAAVTTHDEVVEAGETAYPYFSELLQSIIENKESFI
jgi:purine-nucleoside phosphorylase